MAYTWVFANNIRTTLAASVSASSTSITLASGYGNSLPTLSEGEAFPVTLYDAATGKLIEICYCTARSGDILTVLRGQENTTQQAFSAGDGVDMRLTAGVMNQWPQASEFLQLDDDDDQTVSGPVSFTGDVSVPAATEAANPVPLSQLEGMSLLASTQSGQTVQSFLATVDFSGSDSGSVRISFPQPFKTGTVPVVSISPSREILGTRWALIVPIIASSSNDNGDLLIDNEGFYIFGYDFINKEYAEAENIFPVIAIGTPA